jgi:energy-coupling factor transporter ATP-binding protein EcfA2
MRVALVDGSFWVAIIFVNALGAGFVLYFGVRSVLSGAITLGSLLVVMGYLAQLYDPLYTMSRQVVSLQSGFASAERAFTLLDEERDVTERPDPRPLSRTTGLVEFSNVSFSYEDTRLVLQGVSFKVEPGTRVGITGQTGSGKTTLISLLSRFYDPTSGAVLLDGADLRDFRVSDLRRQFAVVMQDPVLFSTTIGDNIAYGKPGATIDEIMAAAKTAGIHDFVASLPEKYDTAVGEKGMTLSGGERQRISLARAFLIDAPILILDEPTSSVDTADAIIDAMERLMEGRTTFIVAHRLSTLRTATLGSMWTTDRHSRSVRRFGRGGWAFRGTSGSGSGAMGNKDKTVVLLDGLAVHPAFLAWKHICPASTPPASIELLKGENGKTAVYRLRGVTGAGGPVIVKRRSFGELSGEARIYNDVFPVLSLPVVNCYGYLEEFIGNSWLFLEDAGDLRYSPDNPRIAPWDRLDGLLHSTSPKSSRTCVTPGQRNSFRSAR